MATDALDTTEDALADIEAVTLMALERLARRVPPLKSASDKAADLVRTVPRQVTRRARWLDLRRHPWRFGLTVALAAGLAFAAVHGLTEGGPSLRHLPLELLGGTLITAIEAAAALLGFALLGNYLGIRRRTTD